MNTPLLKITNLSIAWRQRGGSRRVVHNASFSLHAGEVLAIVGESGSGKTTLAQSIIGLLGENGIIESGEIQLNGEPVSRWSERQLDALRGASISLIPQDPGSSLNPVKTIGQQVAEVLKLHTRQPKAERESQVVALLEKVGLSHPAQRANQYPHQLSGGMKQRVLIAMAIALKPALIIADEPTSALDVTVQKRILDLLDTLRRESGTAVLFVTHDLALAAQRSDRILVFRDGRIQESGPTAEVVKYPKNPYTRQLFADAPGLSRTLRPWPLRAPQTAAIEIRNLSQHFSLGKDSAQTLRALDDVSFTVAKGTTHALVGESGSGKSTLARILLGFQKPDAGKVLIDGIDTTDLSPEARRQLRQKIQLVYQNPFASLDPSQTLFRIIEEPLLNFGKLSKAERRAKVEAITERVALPLEALTRKPRELSGGQRQRVAIARALILEPQILVLDEATSALDVTVQAQILRLLDDLQRQLGLTYLFISHDLATVRQLAHSVSVLRAGELVDNGPIADVFNAPASDYTWQLLNAIPDIGSGHKDVA
ncbi:MULTISPECIES: ABC transporter ATP-binding protein [Cedecea]|jgi:peptide/nickel transport system ATP-binding protein|uniref:ABC transporter ATP-binding protein n=1 Tax=Cedecea neteri TaxID=158822 RepID=A0A089PS66_9ENTR|nr:MULTISPECIES: ABC transporter ATP-binding protein [Cedecea]AIR03167.1 ABC transporter ATP-binding protein [Cedecea neteri]NWC66069.1 ABC transporter ATP-binding protein [Cedecea sp. P7760]